MTRSPDQMDADDRAQIRDWLTAASDDHRYEPTPASLLSAARAFWGEDLDGYPESVALRLLEENVIAECGCGAAFVLTDDVCCSRCAEAVASEGETEAWPCGVAPCGERSVA